MSSPMPIVHTHFKEVKSLTINDLQRSGVVNAFITIDVKGTKEEFAWNYFHIDGRKISVNKEADLNLANFAELFSRRSEDNKKHFYKNNIFNASYIVTKIQLEIDATRTRRSIIGKLPIIKNLTH